MATTVLFGTTGARAWIGGFAVFALAAFLGWAGLSLAMVNVAGLSSPGLALSFGPGNPVAISKQMDDRIARGAPFPTGSEVRSAAVRSLSAQLLNERAVRLLAFGTEIGGDRTGALALINLAQRLSRRDLRSRLWMIEYFAAAGDADSALAQYDLALRTASRAPAVLHPVLATALDDRGLWQPFSRYLKSRPDWLPHFLAYAIREGEHPEAIAELLLRYGGPEMREMETVLLGRLVAKNETALATNFYLSRPGARAATLRSVDLNAINSDARYIPITWNMFPRADIDPAFVENGRGRKKVLSVRADAGASGAIGRKFIAFEPGTYRVAFTPVAVASGEAYVGWQIVCSATSAVMGSSDGARHNQVFKITGECPTQFFDLLVSNTGQDERLDMTIDNVTIKRIN